MTQKKLGAIIGAITILTGVLIGLLNALPTWFK